MHFEQLISPEYNAEFPSSSCRHSDTHLLLILPNLLTAFPVFNEKSVLANILHSWLQTLFSSRCFIPPNSHNFYYLWSPKNMWFYCIYLLLWPFWV